MCKLVARPMLQGPTCNVSKAFAKRFGDGWAIGVRPNQDPVAGGRRERHTALQLGVISLSAP